MNVKTVSIINMKGGVGKTTLSVNLAYALAKKMDKKVLLVDIDPQFNATQYLVPQEKFIAYLSDESNKTILNIFDNSQEKGPRLARCSDVEDKCTPVTLDNCTIKIYNGKGFLHLIPSTLGLMEIQEMRRGAESRLNQFINKIRDAYDYILIDCPPTMSIYTLSAYLASDAYLTPIKPDYLSSMGTPLLDKAIEQYARDTGKSIRKIGIVFTMVEVNTKIMKGTMEDIRSTYEEDVFVNYLRDSTTIARAVAENLPIFDYKDSISPHGFDMLNIAREFVERIEG